jgi:hypothetical protein
MACDEVDLGQYIKHLLYVTDHTGKKPEIETRCMLYINDNESIYSNAECVIINNIK